MLGAMLALQGAGTAASLFGSWKANKDAREAQLEYERKTNEQYAKDKSKLEAWKAKNSGNYMDTAEANSVMTELFKNAQTQNETVASNTAMTGATNANEVAQKKAVQEQLATALTRMAGQGTQWRNNIDSQYQGQSNMLSNQKQQNNYNSMQMGVANQANKTQQWSNFIQSLAGMGQTAALSDGMGATGQGGGGGMDWLKKLFGAGGNYSTGTSNTGASYAGNMIIDTPPIPHGGSFGNDANLRWARGY